MICLRCCQHCCRRLRFIIVRQQNSVFHKANLDIRTIQITGKDSFCPRLSVFTAISQGFVVHREVIVADCRQSVWVESTGGLALASCKDRALSVHWNVPLHVRTIFYAICQSEWQRWSVTFLLHDGRDQRFNAVQCCADGSWKTNGERLIKPEVLRGRTSR